MESKTKLLDQMRHVLRLKHLSIRTEKAYVQWAKRFILFHHKRHPADMGAPEIRAFLTHLAVEGEIAASTQNVALQALVFLYRHVLKQPFPELDDLEHAEKSRRVPVVFTAATIRRPAGYLQGCPAGALAEAGGWLPQWCRVVTGGVLGGSGGWACVKSGFVFPILVQMQLL